MSIRLYIAFAAAAALGLGLGLSCTQDDGGRCQIHSDCASGICCKTNPAADHTSDGICTATQAICDELIGGGTDADADGDGDADVPVEAEAEADAADDADPDAAD
ncbi:MAG: hypothetical protein JXB32_02005, partial [Deltaproteobacteria bacterium]|nr:hypothetical protein [Deltaproteobacteria bacterium]